MANVNKRAQRLHDDGYRAQRLDEFAAEVTTPAGKLYLVDTLTDRCDCDFFAEHQGLHPCKHLLGLKNLLEDQEREALLGQRQLDNEREIAALERR